MKLHHNIPLFKETLISAAGEMKINYNYVEKDYWVSYVLNRLSHSEYKDKFVFKGGTSLSKVYKLIPRFSEDIDLQLFDPGSKGDSAKKKLFKKAEKEITLGLSLIPDLCDKHGNIRKTCYDYSKSQENAAFGFVSSHIVLEINSMSVPEPFIAGSLISFAGEFLNKIGRAELVKQYGLDSFDLNVLDIRRTYLEKLFAVLDASMKDEGFQQLIAYSRHIFDIYYFAGTQKIRDFINKDECGKMADRVYHENDFFGKRMIIMSRLWLQILTKPLKALNQVSSIILAEWYMRLCRHMMR